MITTTAFLTSFCCAAVHARQVLRGRDIAAVGAVTYEQTSQPQTPEVDAAYSHARRNMQPELTNATDNDYFTVLYGTDKDNALEQLSLASEATQPSQEQEMEKADKYWKAEADKYVPKDSAKEGGTDNYYPGVVQYDTEAIESAFKYLRLLAQFIFGLLYYILIIRKYPKLNDTQPSSHAVELQEKNEVVATCCCHVSKCNCLMSWCCSGPRAAHTFHSIGELDYWPGLVFMTFLPCCTLCLMNAMADLNVKLGGQRRNLCMSCLCACFCSCCVIAQDAEALDLTTGVRTGCFGVYEDSSHRDA